MPTLTKLLITLPTIALLFSACGDRSPGNKTEATTRDTLAVDDSAVPFTAANGYFVRNDLPPTGQLLMVMEDQGSFEAVLGMATTMGPEGKPTPIDFNRQFAIALIAPETDTAVTLEAVSLRSLNGQLHFSYRRNTGDKQSFTTRPLLLVLVDRSQMAPVVLEEG